MADRFRKTHKTAIVIIPPEDFWAPIQAIRQQHDRKVARWMPHITLIYPFVERAEFDRVTKDLSATCSKLRPFDLELTGVETFNHGKGYHTVWLRPELETSVLDLHAALWTELSYDEEFEPRLGRFTPHLSVGQVRGFAKMVELVKKLKVDWTPIRFRVAAVHLIWREDRPDDVFRIDRTLQLGDR